MEGLLEEVRRSNAFGEGKGIRAKLGFGVEEDGFVYEVLAKEGSVEMRASFKEEAEDVVFGQSFED
jgi:hypothetical protein